MVPFLNNQKGYNSSTTHSASLFVSTATRSDCFRPYQLALDPSRPPLFVASFKVSTDRSVNRAVCATHVKCRAVFGVCLYLECVCVWCMSAFCAFQMQAAHNLFNFTTAVNSHTSITGLYLN